MAAHFGYSLGVGAIPVKKFAYDAIATIATGRSRSSAARSCCPMPACNIASRKYQKLVAKIEGKPEERILSYLMLRSLKQARYSEENVGHFALAADTLHALHVAHPPLSGSDRAPPADGVAGSRERSGTAVRMAEECSQSERRAAEAERELVEWKKVKFMRSAWARSSTG